MDNRTPEQRSRIMASVKNRDTVPERLVRSIIHRMGYRFRLHVRNLPGKPDIVLPRHRKVIFVDGCFWHGHRGCRRSARPATNTNFWNAKIDRNIKRDIAIRKALRSMGWRVLVIWECSLRKEGAIEKKLEKFLTDDMLITSGGCVSGASPSVLAV